MKYQKVWAPNEEVQKAHSYAEQLAGHDVLEAVNPIRWEDGTLGFEINILKRGGLNIMTITTEQLANSI